MTWRPGPGVYHEAGHAVVAHHSGLKIAWVNLQICQLDLTRLDDFESFLTSAMAGGVSTWLAGRGEKSPSRGDWQLVTQFWPVLNDPLQDVMTSQGIWAARFEVAQDEAEKILRANWPAVERLAAALSYSGYLTGEQVVKIITRL